MRWPAVVVAVLLASTALVAQDAVKTLPQNYRIEFENEYVRVTRVLYPAHAKLPGHTHTSLPTAYVYLNDSGPVAFKHVGHKAFSATRPPTVARSYRLFRGLEEVHEVENLSEKPSEFLRVEFKTDPAGDPRTLRGKFLPPAAGGDVMQQVEFENTQIRVTRVIAPAGKTTSLSSTSRPSIVISLTEGAMGNAAWLRQGEARSVGETARTAEVLRFELKTEVKTTR
jgi:hypothetical protein